VRLQDTTYARGPRTLVELTAMLADDGFGGTATAVEGGRVRCDACGHTEPADTLDVHSLYRTEGASDPADMAAVVAFSCGNCGSGNGLVLAYGPNASGEEADVLAALPDHPAADQGEHRTTG